MHRFLVAAFAVACSLLVAPASAQKGTPEARIGVEFKPPKGWVELPGGGDRGATLRLFAAPRALTSKAKGTAHTPVMRVMFFPKGGDAGKDVVDGLPRTTAFRSIDDFVQRGSGSNNTQVKKEAAKAGTVDGQHFVAKIGSEAGDRVIVGHSFALDDGEAAVCFEVLEDHLDKIQKDADATLASLAACARQKDDHVDPAWIEDPAAWSTMDVAARTAARRKWAETLTAATAKAPEAGFKVQKSKYWTVLSDAEPGFTKKAIAAAEAARAFFTQKMPEPCKDALPAVLRIFDSPDHYNAYLNTRPLVREYDPARRELLFMDDPDNGGSTGYGMLFRAVLWQVCDDLDPLILPALPRWLDNGLWEFLRSSRCDGKKIDFAPGDVENGRIDYQLRANTVPHLWDLIQESIQPSPADGKNEDPWGYTPECARLIRWCWMGDGQKAFDDPDLLVHYLRGLATVAAKNGPDPTRDVATAGLSTSDQGELNRRHFKWRDAIVKDTSYAVLPKEEVWRAADEKWQAYVKAGH